MWGSQVKKKRYGSSSRDLPRSREGRWQSRKTSPLTLHRLWLSTLVVLTVVPLLMRFLGGAQVASLLGQENINFAQSLLARSEGLPSIEIFSAPKPFVGADRELNLRAVKSWLALVPEPRVTLLGWEAGYEEATALGVGVDIGIDRNFLGVPLFNSLLERANRSNADVAVLINGDIILGQEFVTVLERVRQHFMNYLLIAARYDIDSIPEGYDADSRSDKLRHHVDEVGQLHTYGGMDLWAWNTQGPRMVKFTVPHFVFGRGKYDNWLVHEAIDHDEYAVVDVSESIMLVHVKHDYRLVTGAAGAEKNTTDSTFFWSEQKRAKFELFANIYSSLSVGSYRNQRGTLLHAPYKMIRCEEDSGTCLLKRVRPAECLCEFSPFSHSTQTDPTITSDMGDNGVLKCGMVSTEERSEFKLPIVPGDSEDKVFGLPLTLDDLLERVSINETVVMTAVTYSHRELLFNWVCNLRRLGTTNFVIAALDEQTYEYGFLRGFPIYYENSLSTDAGTPAEGTSPELRALQIVGFSVVERVLEMGYDVLWSDTDVVWFRDPFPDLNSLDSDLLIMREKQAVRNPEKHLVLDNNSETTGEKPKKIIIITIPTRRLPLSCH